MKKIISIILVVLMLAATMAACDSASANKPFPNKPITLIAPYSAGGSTDIGARLIAAEMEKILGVPVTVTNITGAGGWIGWTELMAAEKDGYTIAHLNTPNVFSGYLDPQQNRDNSIADFEPIFCYVNDMGTISIRPDETRFTNLEELIEYAKENEVTVTSTGAFGDDHIASVKMNEALGTKFVAVHNKGSGESLTAVMGGHVDVLFANVGDCKVPHESGQVVTIGVMNDVRSTLMPDIPTVKEVTGIEVISSSARGITAMAGIDEEALKVLTECLEKVSQSEDLKNKMLEQGLEYTTVLGQDYKDMLNKEEESLKTIAGVLGWE